MCRYVCPVTRVTYSESTSPHGWALLIASVRRGLLDWNAETTDLLYQCADCGLCQSFCATDRPLPDAIVAARAEVAATGHVPTAVAELRAALGRWGNPYGANEDAAERATGADVALFVGAAARHRERSSVSAARRLLDAVGLDHAPLAIGRSSGYLPYTLGLHEAARELAQATVAEVERSGCRRLVALSPEQAPTLGHVYPLLGVPLPAEVEVVELTVLLAQMLDEGRLRLGAAEPLDLAYHDPCQTPRLKERWHAPRRLLAASHRSRCAEGFWREQRAAPCGASGGLPWTQPQLAARMAERGAVRRDERAPRR